MLNTLRRRLTVSHILPLLVIIPLMGIALVYVLETQVLLPTLSNDLRGQAALVVEITNEHTDIWHESARAQAFVARVAPHLTARLMLLDSDGHLLASSDPADADRLGSPLDHAGLTQILAGETNVHADYSQHLSTEVADVFVPVFGADKRVIGIVRLTHRLAGIYEWFVRLRYLIAGVLAAGLVLGTTVGWTLALNLESPLRQVTLTLDRLASGQELTLLPEQGPEEIRLLTRTFNSLVERLRTLEQTRQHLLSNLVHELGRPLGALHSAIRALVGGADQDVALRRELLTGMDDEIKHLRRLLDDLARLRDQVTGSLELARRPTALSEWLPHVLASWREAAQAKGLRWEATIATDLPTVAIDPDRLAQAVGNLLSNAIKYTPPKGVVSVEADVENGATWVRVSDTGPGIPPEEQARIFTPFYRGSTGRRFPQGMGLGLSIAHDLVVAHGGRLEVTSTPGQGSRFTLWLPLTPSPRE